MESLRMPGRKPLGPALVEHLDGSANAKERLELILKTLSGQITVVAACRTLDISEAMFYKLRNRVLQCCLEDLEPKPRGRPPQTGTSDQDRYEELSAELTELRRELEVKDVRLELAHALPHVMKPASLGPLKKTTASRKAVAKRRAK
jgi:transposase-like protein